MASVRDTAQHRRLSEGKRLRVYLGDDSRPVRVCLRVPADTLCSNFCSERSVSALVRSQVLNTLSYAKRVQRFGDQHRAMESLTCVHAGGHSSGNVSRALLQPSASRKPGIRATIQSYVTLFQIALFRSDENVDQLTASRCNKALNTNNDVTS
jgi:hypothetical protein